MQLVVSQEGVNRSVNKLKRGVFFAWKRAHREPHLESAISRVKHRPLQGTVSITRMASHAGGVFFNGEVDSCSSDTEERQG